MKNKLFKGRKRGFTMAELLTVIAILVILIGLGVTGFIALRQKIQIAKYDDLAREIYVAVQNQLTRLEANGMDADTVKALEQNAGLGEQPEDYEEGDWPVEQDNYHYANERAEVMELLLPLGAVADDVRSNGFYCVEYNAKTNMVYGVFYSEKQFEYSAVSREFQMKGFRLDRSVRKGPMVGYYGGSAVKRDPVTHCDVPQLEIINNNELRLNILNVPTDVNITVLVSDGEHTCDASEKNYVLPGADATTQTVLLDGMKNTEHFYQRFPELIPGKDLTVTVTYQREGSISASASVTANSLFATREPGEQEPEGGVQYENPGDTVTIAWARHLQNLEYGFSHLDDAAISLARQTEHIQWNDGFHLDFQSIRNENANPNLKRYEGGSLEIRDLTGSNGLFAVAEGMTLSGIRVVNPVIENTIGETAVGALVGAATAETRIEFCAVYSSKIADDGAVNYSAYQDCYVNGGAATTGGLIGTAAGVTVSNSFAALPSIQGHGASLIGSASGCTIENSYANCDNLPEKGFLYFIGGTGNTVGHCYAVGNVESDANGGFAPQNNTISDSYYAVSHRAFAADPKDNQDLSATEFCYMEPDGWKQTNQEGMTEAVLTGQWADRIAPLSHPYREYLDGRAYPYPAIGALDHYGSWPDGDGTVNLTIRMQLLNNEEAGYAIFAGRVAVTTKKDGTDVTLFDSEDYKDDEGNYNGEDPTVKVAPGTEVTITVTDAEGYSYVNTVIGGRDTTQPVLTHTVSADTEVKVNFQQRAFRLTGLLATGMNDEGKITTLVRAPYYIDLESPMKTLVVNNQQETEDVETGSTVTVRTPNPSGYIASVVWYTPHGKTDEADRVYLTRQEDGSYSFPMPPQATDLHVMYTKKAAYFDIQFQMMDPEGEYQNQPAQSYSCGVGSQINRGMISAMADSSGLPLVIDGERVRYLAEAEVTDKSGNVVYTIQLDEDGRVLYSSDPHITQLSESDKDNHYQVTIKIDRKQYTVTLTADAHVDGVRFGTDGDFEKTVTRKYYYGASVTASAEVVSGYGFSYWDPQDSRFLMSADPVYTFQVPHFDLNILATATLNQRLVTINLLNNGDNWLYSDESRQDDPITLTLVSTVDGREYPMNVLTEDTISYAMQAVVPAIPEYEKGYQVRVDYDSGAQKQSWLYASGGGETDEDNTRLLLTVRDAAVEQDAEFYSITYFPNKQHTLGSVPKGGVYPKYSHIRVEGNSGYLRNETDGDKIFCGWKDHFADGTGSETVYTGGEVLMLTHRVDMFAEWTNHLQVIYHAGDADGGELPVDNNDYLPGTVTIKWGSLTRKGYEFLGWAMEEKADDPYFTPGGVTTYELTNEDLNLYPVWKQEEYTLSFYDPNGQLLTGESFEMGVKHYGELVEAPGLEVELSDGKTEQIIGWSLTPGGPILCQPGEKLTVTGNMDLYARLAEAPVTVTFMPMDGEGEAYDVQNFGKGVPGYLNCVPESGPVTAWSTQPEGKGDLYFCQEDGRSEKAYAFTEDEILYAVTGKVYNYNQQLWDNTLGAAVKRASSGDTLIVYRDTKEPYSIWINKSLYVISSGNRCVTWIDGATTGEGGHRLDDTTQEKKEYVGCMNVSNSGSPVTVTFGSSDVPTLSMNGGALTFDANEQSRVISLGNKATFNMYDGITLTRGKRVRADNSNPDESSDHARASEECRSYYGGGVYAGLESVFNMYGGTISYCTAYKGGGVYLYANKDSATPGSKMQMGNMVTPTAYSSTAIYYEKDSDGYYKNASNVTAENYKKYYIAVGNPVISYNTATRKYNSTGNIWSFNDGGGGLLMLDLKDGDLVLYKGSINNNTAYANGGGLISDAGDTKGGVLGNSAKLRIYEVDISHNTAYGYGGGIFQWQGVVYVYNSVLRQNYAEKSGGGIYLHHWENENQTAYDLSTVEFHYGDIEDNKAGENGGGIYVESRQTMIITHGNLKRNSAGENGGGVYIARENDKDGYLSLEGGTVADNTAQNGGGIYSNGTVEMSGGTLSGNMADNWGGGVYSTGRITVSGGVVCSNSARYLGGGIWQGGELYLSGGSLYGNTDTDYADPRDDEDNVHPGPNDIYLVEDHVITIPAGGIQLSGEERVAVDCDRDESLRFQKDGKKLPWRFAVYQNTGNYNPKDALYFTYYGTRSTEYSMQTLGKKNLKVATHEDLRYSGWNQIGLYFAEDNGGDGINSLVAFDFNYPDCKNPEAKEYKVGDVLNLDDSAVVEQPTRPGYYLAGWARTPDVPEEQWELFYDVTQGKWGSAYQSGSGWTVWKDVPEYTVKDYFSQTLYAMWKPCVVVYDLGADAAENGVKIQSPSSGPNVTLLNPQPVSYAKDGKDYVFDHWEDQTADPAGSYLPTQRLTLTENLYLSAVWKERSANAVVLTFYYNGGSSGQPGELCRPVEVPKEGSGQAPEDVQKITQGGKILMGWATTQDALTADYAKDYEFKNLEADMALYAVWADAVTITYDVNEGEGGNLSDLTYVGGSAAIITTVPTRYGYDFLGWAEKPDAPAPQYHAGDTFGPVNGDTTLYALWRAKVWVRLMQNDRTETAFQEALESVGGGYTIPTEEPTWEGYTFLGWADNPDATAPGYKQDQTISIPEGGITLYALWSKNPRYTVAFDLKGGRWESGPDSVTEDEKGALTIPAEEPIREGCTFLGWAAETDAADPQYLPGDTIYDLTEDKTLYALWAEAVTADIHGNDGTETGEDPPAEDPAADEAPVQPVTEAAPAPSEEETAPPQEETPEP